MTTRARTSKTTPTKTAAKKPAARKPAAKRATRTPSKTTPALSLVKAAPEQAHAPAPTLVDLKNPLRMRRRLFVGPMGATEQAAVRAALAATSARLPIPVRTWNGSTAQLADGTLLIHNPGPDRHFTAHIACPHGAIHGYPIRTLNDLQQARSLTAACERPHGGVNADQAITAGVNAIPPKTTPVLVVHEGLRRTAETQPLSTTDIAEGLATRTPDTETPKEHPHG